MEAVQDRSEQDVLRKTLGPDIPTHPGRKGSKVRKTSRN